MSRKRSAVFLDEDVTDEATIYHPSSPIENESNDKLCQICNKEYQTTEALNKHNRRKHPISVRLYACQIQGCRKTFPTFKEKQDHMSRHSKIKTIICPVAGCAAKYTTLNSLHLHTTRKHEDKRYICPYCVAAYGVNGDLNQHLRRKHKIEPRDMVDDSP